MIKKQQIIQSIEEIPEFILTVVLNCIELIESHEQYQVPDSFLFSKFTLTDGWLTREEEEVW
ncbi:hypothetical protein [Crocosphaera sp. Alani8]|uniref:hypothetical protein n=1 Tax=Crocosphaera sp. Alani8 TaxID=3038952 RepID=UPI00313DEBFB